MNIFNKKTIFLFCIFFLFPINGMHVAAVKVLEVIAKVLVNFKPVIITDFKSEEQPELYKILKRNSAAKLEEKTQSLSDTKKLQDTNPLISYVPQEVIASSPLYQAMIKGNYRFVAEYIEQAQKENATAKLIPATGDHDWKECAALTDSDITIVKPELIAQHLNTPVIAVKPHAVEISREYFEQFKPGSIVDRINTRVSLNGRTVARSFNPDNRLFFDVNVRTEQHQQTYYDRYIQEISYIAQDPKLAEQFNHEAQRLETVFATFFVQSASVENSLLALSDPNNFKTLRMVNHFDEQLKSVSIKLQNIFLNKDGSVKAGWTVGCEKDIARAIAYFQLQPGDHKLFDLMNIAQDLQKKGIPGAHALLHELNEQANKGIFESIADGISAIVDSIDGTSALPDLTAKMRENPLNKDMRQMLALCDQNKWIEAKAIAEKYEQEFINNRNSESARNGYYLARQYLQEKTHSAKTYERYSSDPFFAEIVKSDAKNLHNYLPILEKRLEVKNYILKMIGVSNPSLAVERLSYELAPHFFDPKAIAQCLSFLSADHPDQQIRDLYHTFHDSNGIAKILAYDVADLQGVTIPENIGDARNVEARKAINVLVKLDTPNEQTKAEVRNALTFAVKSCSEDELHVGYAALSRSMTTAAISESADKTILQADDFTTLDKTEEQKVLQLPIVLTSAKIAFEIDKTKSTKHKRNLQIVLHGLTALSKLAKLDINYAHEFYVNKLDKYLDEISEYDGSYESHKKYFRLICQSNNLSNEATFNNASSSQNNQQSPAIFPDPEDPENKKNDKNITEKDAQEIWDKSNIDELKKQVEKIKESRPNDKIDTFQKKVKDNIKEFYKYEKMAKDLYELISRMKDDVAKISNNTGISQNIIDKIKNHLFHQEHILSNGIRKFDPDFDIAQAWLRLINNTYVQSDLTFLLHEYAESLIMKGTVVPWAIAHPITRQRFNWEVLLQ